MVKCWQCPQIGRQLRNKEQAAIALQCKLNGKLIAALFYICIAPLFEDIAVMGIL